MHRFYPITDSADSARQLFEAGVKFLQLRIKAGDDNFLKKEIIAAQFYATKYSATLVINDYWQLAVELHCKHVHLGQEDLALADTKRLRLKGINLGISTHTLDELHLALTFSPFYVALGPIFPTKLKKMKYPPQGVEKISLWKSIANEIPVVAIGGITLETAETVLQAKADSIAVVTDLLSAPNMKTRAKDWLKLTESI